MQRALVAQVTVLLAAGAVRDRAAAGRFLFLSTVGNHGLLPLLFGPAEYPIKARTIPEFAYPVGSAIISPSSCCHAYGTYRAVAAI